MQQLFLILLILFPLNHKSSNKQELTLEKILSEVAEGFETGKTELIIQHLDPQCNFSFGSVEIYDRSTQIRIQTFFEAHPPLAFKIIHQGKTARTTYLMAEYKSEVDEFNIQIFLDNEKEKIVVLKIVSENQ